MQGPEFFRARAMKYKTEEEQQNKERFANILSAVDTSMRVRASQGHFDTTIDTGHIYYYVPGGHEPICYRLDGSEIQRLVEHLKGLGFHVEMRIDPNPHLDDLIFIKW